MSIRVLLVDDHAVVRQGVRGVLGGEEFAIVGEAGTGREALAVAASTGPDVILLDITLPGESGLDLVEPLLGRAPGARILMLSVHDNSEYVLRAVRAGAHGYVRKDTTPAELRAAVRAVHQGAGFFSPEVAGNLASALRDPEDPAPGAEKLSSLTAREREVLVEVAQGLRNKEIAARLGISVRTVEAHRENLARKLGRSSAADLTRLAVEHGLIKGRPEGRKTPT